MQYMKYCYSSYNLNLDMVKFDTKLKCQSPVISQFYYFIAPFPNFRPAFQKLNEMQKCGAKFSVEFGKFHAVLPTTANHVRQQRTLSRPTPAGANEQNYVPGNGNNERNGAI